METKELLICGDLHTHYNILTQVEELIPQYEKIVFLGDYVDDWDAIPESSYNILNELIALKKENPDKIILLLANHDASEWQAGIFKCSGYNEITHQLVKPLLDENEDLFDIAFEYQGTVYTHAGITRAWWAAHCEDIIIEEEHSAKNYAAVLNWALHNRKTDEKAMSVFEALAEAGETRGGHGNPSPIWADSSELISDWGPIKQVVGHTPHPTITHYDLYSRNLYFCDTHSTARGGIPLGDNSLLVFNNNEFSRIHIDGTEYPW